MFQFHCISQSSHKIPNVCSAFMRLIVRLFMHRGTLKSPSVESVCRCIALYEMLIDELCDRIHRSVAWRNFDFVRLHANCSQYLAHWPRIGRDRTTRSKIKVKHAVVCVSSRMFLWSSYTWFMEHTTDYTMIGFTLPSHTVWPTCYHIDRLAQRRRWTLINTDLQWNWNSSFLVWPGKTIQVQTTLIFRRLLFGLWQQSSEASH